jgi:hypothetical protein
MDIVIYRCVGSTLVFGLVAKILDTKPRKDRGTTFALMTICLQE